MRPAFRTAAEDLASLVPDGAFIALPPDYSMPAMAVVRALVLEKKKNLKLLGVPVLGMCADLLIGAGCVREVESSAVSLGEAGLAPRFSEAAEKGEIVVRDATCPAVHTALQASEKGVPFMPLIRIDVPTYSADDLPEELAAIPAIKPGSRATA